MKSAEVEAIARAAGYGSCFTPTLAGKEGATDRTCLVGSKYVGFWYVNQGLTKYAIADTDEECPGQESGCVEEVDLCSSRR